MPRALSVVLCLGLLVFAAYAPVSGHEFVSFDDTAYVLEPHVAEGLSAEGVKWAFTTFHKSNWHPVTWLSHMLDNELFGVERPGAHHWTSVLLHFVNSCLLLLLLARATGAFWRSTLVAALFALHPVHVESVAWVAERKDVLSTLFWLGSTLAYVEYARRNDKRWYALCALLLAFGLMAKPMLVTAPFVFLLLDYWPLQRLAPPAQSVPARSRRKGRARRARRAEPAGPSLRSLIVEKIPLLALVTASSAVTLMAQQGAVGNAPLWHRLANAIQAYAGYLVHTFWPVNLAVLYPYRRELVAWQLVGALALLLLVTVWVLRQRRHRHLTMGWLWFLGTLVPVIGIVQVGVQSMADRYLYVPMIGILVMVAWAGAAWCERRRHGRAIGAVVAALAIAACTGLAHRQVGTWSDSITLYRHATEVTRDNHEMHYSLASELAHVGENEQAIHHYREAVRIRPDFAEAHNDLAIAIADEDPKQAVAHLRKALEIRPDYPQARDNLGLLLGRQGQVDELFRSFFEDKTSARR